MTRVQVFRRTPKDKYKNIEVTHCGFRLLFKV